MQNKHINYPLHDFLSQTLTLTQKRLKEERMKESVKASSGGGRSESDKERTKLRERQRRAITTKIFHGLRKWGGYSLSPRADINEVLRELAKEAGWIIEPDGTTYRATLPMNPCLVCGSTTPTPSSSTVMVGGGGEDCSTTASPRRRDPPNINNITSGSTTTSSPYFSGEGGLRDLPLALYLYGRLPSGPNPTTTTTTTSSPVIGAQQQLHLQEMRASNQNTPAASPLHRPF